VACVCWFESNALNDSMSFKKRGRSSKSSNNAGEILTHNACNASSSGVKDGALGEEVVWQKLLPAESFLILRCIQARLIFPEQWFGDV